MDRINKIELPATLSKLTGSIIAGLIVGMTVVVTGASFAAFIYSGQLAGFFSLGVEMVLAGSILVLLITTLFGSLPITIAIAQDESLAIYAVMASSVVALISEHTTDAILSTIFVTHALAGVLTGLLFLRLGMLKLGNLISFIPFPVIGGFLAGIGWFLFRGSFGLLIPRFNGLSTLFDDSTILLHWIPAVLYAILLMIATRKPHPAKWPLLIAGGIAVFYIVLVIFRIPLSVATENDFLLNFASSSGHALSIQNLSWQKVDWHVVFSQIPSMLVIVLLSTIGIFFNTSGLEVLLKKDIDTNKELRVNGVANIFAGLVGGINGYATITLTMFNNEVQRSVSLNTRFVGLVTAAVCIPTIFYGAALLAYVPRFLSGGLLMFFGITMLKQWVYEMRHKLPLSDFIIIATILLTMIFFGLLKGIFVGILFSVGFFIVQFSNARIIKSTFTGKNLHSNKQYDPKTQELLQESGHEILYFQLQNYLFFGNTGALLQKLIRHTDHSNKVRYVIYDCSYLTGMDYSAAVIFDKMKQLAQRKNVLIILTNVSKKIHRFLEKSNVLDKDPVLQIFLTSDAALEWCEENIINRNKLLPRHTFHLEDKLVTLSNNREVIADFRKYFEEIKLPKGSVLFHAGELSDELYYIESGQLTIYVEGNLPLRLRTICPGNIVGEVALYTQQKRSASVLADQDCVLQKLTKSNLKKMESHAPELAIYFNEYIIQTLAERLVYANRQAELLRSDEGLDD